MSISTIGWAIAGLLLVTSCKTDRKGEADATHLLEAVSLSCEYLGEQEGTPRYAVYALLDESKVKLAELPACDTILSMDYRDKGIPADALGAVGGWWAGRGDYIYTDLKDGLLTFYIGSVDETSDSPIPTYMPLAVYEDRKFQLMRPIHPADLAGYYWHQSQDTSYVLFIGLKGSDLVNKVFATAEPMPPQKVLQRALPEFAATPDVPMTCDLNSLSFESGLGYGSIFWRPDTAAVTFQSFMGVEREVVFEFIAF
ncbi:MAG: hypothetical protein R2795_10640 [Saprospiraceae bacterium]